MVIAFSIIKYCMHYALRILIVPIHHDQNKNAFLRTKHNISLTIFCIFTLTLLEFCGSCALYGFIGKCSSCSKLLSKVLNWHKQFLNRLHLSDTFEWVFEKLVLWRWRLPLWSYTKQITHVIDNTNERFLSPKIYSKRLNPVIGCFCYQQTKYCNNGWFQWKTTIWQL